MTILKNLRNDKTEKLKIWQNSKTQNVKIKNSKTQHMTKLPMWYCDKTQNLKCEKNFKKKTQIAEKEKTH